jgi:protein phosphatase
VGQTLKLPAEKGSLAEVQTYDWQNNRNENLQYNLEKDRLINLSPRLVEDQRSWLFLEVIAGPAIGLQHAVNSTSSSKLPVKLGRVSPSDLALKDSEVSGKHAQITWNSTVRSYVDLFIRLLHATSYTVRHTCLVLISEI